VGWRLVLPDDSVTFDDLAHGPTTQTPTAQCGDLLLRDRLGNWTYQLAVVVDDMLHGIDLVVRGDDLFASTGRQIPARAPARPRVTAGVLPPRPRDADAHAEAEQVVWRKRYARSARGRRDARDRGRPRRPPRRPHPRTRDLTIADLPDLFVR
jgi:glutamyl-tRNA synthetase/glutamyl-Q tRNA(Asp) synthetase